MQSWKLEFTEVALRDLGRLPKTVSRIVIDKLNQHVKNFDTLKPLPLHQEWRGYFKLRVGDWRVAYEIDFLQRVLSIAAIDHRRDIYKRKPPKLRE